MTDNEADQARVLARFLDQLPLGVFVLDASGRPYYANAMAEKLLGQGVTSTSADQLGTTYQAYIAGTNTEYPVARMPVVAALRGEVSKVEDIEIERPDARVPLKVWATPVFNPSGTVAYAVAAFQDISERRAAEAAARTSQQRFQSAFDHAPIGMALVDPDGRFIKVNPALSEITGYSEAELLETTCGALSHPGDHADDERLLERLLAGDIPRYQLEKRYRRRDGVQVWTLVARSLVVDPEHGPLYITQIEDIDARKRAERDLVEMTLHDPLTGLANRLLLRERLESLAARHARHDGTIAALYVDIDGFKRVNDEFGHAVGDDVLVHVAQHLSSCLRRTDTAARIGGDEFVILLDGLHGEQEAQEVARRVGTVISAPVEAADTEIVVTASVGVASRAQAGWDADELLREADAAMYRVKSGR